MTNLQRLLSKKLQPMKTQKFWKKNKNWKQTATGLLDYLIPYSRKYEISRLFPLTSGIKPFWDLHWLAETKIR